NVRTVNLITWHVAIAREHGINFASPGLDHCGIFLEILPNLPPGVLVHIHDIFLPLDYPPEWNDRFYSEQYMLAAMLLCRDRPFDIILPNCYAMSDPALSEKASTLLSGTGIDPALAVSFWMGTRER